LPEVNAYQVGSLIALYERTVSLYALLIGVNAYHQPGVEAGKKAAQGVLDLQHGLLKAVHGEAERWWDAESLALVLGRESEEVFLMMRHLAATRSSLQARGEGLALEIRHS
jgi:glucose-6-phosphate isomerase